MTVQDPNTPPATPPPVTPPAVPAPVFTQEQMNAQMAREADQARRQRDRELMERLGVSTVEEAEQILKDVRDKDTARLSDVERKEKEAEKATRDANAAKAEADKVLRNSKIRDALLDAGVKRERLAVAARSVDVPEGADDAGITAAVKTYSEEVPEFFDASNPDDQQQQQQQNGPTPSPASTPAPRQRPAGKPDESGYDRGKERAQRMAGVVPDAAAGAGGQGA